MRASSHKRETPRTPSNPFYSAGVFCRSTSACTWHLRRPAPILIDWPLGWKSTFLKVIGNIWFLRVVLGRVQSYTMRPIMLPLNLTHRLWQTRLLGWLHSSWIGNYRIWTSRRSRKGFELMGSCTIPCLRGVCNREWWYPVSLMGSQSMLVISPRAHLHTAFCEI